MGRLVRDRRQVVVSESSNQGLLSGTSEHTSKLKRPPSTLRGTWYQQSVSKKVTSDSGMKHCVVSGCSRGGRTFHQPDGTM